MLKKVLGHRIWLAPRLSVKAMLVLVACCGALLWSVHKLWETNPTNQLVRLLRSHDPAGRREAAERLGFLGMDAETAVPALTRALNDGDVLVRVRAASTLALFFQTSDAAIPPLLDALKDKDPRVRSLAAETLGAIGRQAKKTVPALIALLGDPSPAVCQAAATALGSFGPNKKTAARTFVMMSQDDEVSVRTAALFAVAYFGTDHTGVVPGLVAALNDRAPEIRFAAVAQLGRQIRAINWSNRSALPGILEAVIPALCRVVDDRDARVRRVALETLGSLCPWAAANLWREERERALKALYAALDDPDTRVRQAASAALMWIHIDYALPLTFSMTLLAFPVLNATLQDEDVKVCLVAQNALAIVRSRFPDPNKDRYHELFKSINITIISALNDDDDAVRLCAIKAISNEDPESAQAAISALRPVLKDRDATVRAWAAIMLGQSIPQVRRTDPSFQPDLEALLPVLCDALRAEDEEVSSLALKALLDVARQAVTIDPARPRLFEGVVAQLREKLRDPHLSSRRLATQALGELGAGVDSALAPLREALNDEDETVRQLANRFLTLIENRRAARNPDP